MIDLNSMWNFLDSNFLTSIVALSVGMIAFYLYDKQKNDSKKDAANIILLEIQSAERILGQISEEVRSGNLPNKFLLPTESWSKYKYYFVRDFDRDEWDLITGFYNNAKLYDEAVAYNNSLFQKNEEQIRINMLCTPAEYIREFIENSKDSPSDIDESQRLEKIFEKSQKFQKTYLSRIGSLFYNPQKPLTDATNAFNGINKTISQISVGNKLKRLAGLKK